MSIFERHLSKDEVVNLIESQPLNSNPNWFAENNRVFNWLHNLWTLFTNPSNLHKKQILLYRERIISSYLQNATNPLTVGNGSVFDKSKEINEHLAAARLIEAYARLVVLSKKGLNESQEADDIRDSMDVYYFAVGRSEETLKRVQEICAWLQNAIDPMPETIKA